MSRPSALLALLVLSGLPGAAIAGWWEGGNPPDLRGTHGLQSLQVSGKVTGYKLKANHGRTVAVTLATPQGLDQPLTLPAGDWAELTLILDGPVTLVQGGVVVQLSVDTLTVVLDDPSARKVHLDWTLPQPLSRLAADPDALIPALEDGGLASP